jgi:hypothetical protein
MSSSRKSRALKIGGGLAVLAAASATAAGALSGGGNSTSTPTAKPKPHVDIEALATKRGVPTDPAERARFLRKEVLVLSWNGLITQAQAQRALREIKRTGTLGGYYGSAAPAFKVRRLASLPPQAHVPAEVRRFVEHVGELTHSGLADINSVRLLRADLGKGHADVYGVKSATGSPCFILTGYGGTCAPTGRPSTSGLAWIVGGSHDGLPSVFVGIAGDDVQKIELLADGISVPVSFEGGVAFAELPTGAQSGVVTTTRAGNRVASEPLPLTG